jgi:predicted nucleic acid-binding protein
MKILVDTCGWIEWLTNGKLAASFEPYLLKPENLIVPTLIQYELYKWACREKDSTTALQIIGMTENGIIVPFDTKLALDAADISKKHGLSMADAIIYASSENNKALLITADKHFKELTHVKFFEKKCVSSPA